MNTAKEFQQRIDGLSNVINKLTGLGTDYDSITTTDIQDYSFVSHDRGYLDKLFRNTWQCRKVCSYLPYMGTQTWGWLKLANSPKKEERLNDKQVKQLRSLYRDGQTWANLYGGSTVVRFVEDGRPEEKPIDWENVKSLTYSRVYDRWEIVPDWTMNYNNPYEPDYYLFYSTYPDEKIVTASRVHKDRILRFRGNNLPPQTIRESEGWEDSVLVGFLTPMFRYLGGTGHIGDALKNFEFTIYMIQNLFKKIEGGKINKTGAVAEKEITERLMLIQQQASSMRGIALDKDAEDVKMLSRNFSNVDRIHELLKNEMIAASGLTKPQFYQEHPNGMAATGKSERMAESDELLAYQDEKWGDQLDIDLKLMTTLNKVRGEYTWRWKPLYAETPGEKIRMRERVSLVDERNINNGIYTAQEVRESRYATADFNEEIKLKEKLAPAEKDPDAFKRNKSNGSNGSNGSNENFFNQPEKELIEVKENKKEVK